MIIVTSLLLGSSLDNSRDTKFHNLLTYALVSNENFLPTIHYSDTLHSVTTSLQVVKLSMRMSMYLGRLPSLTLFLWYNNHSLTPQPL